SLKTSIKTITYLSDIGCLEIHGASLVLKGEMSLVGPRPIITAELERYNEEVDYYLLSKPGMTGLWQVSGRSDVDYETRVYLDAWYVKNWSMWNDIAILFKTVGVVLKKDGAY
ncbi:sugar transferase, partial [Escherichia coli]|uniref:sugar transferase n=1 Tax=Escherichia coli TaxID=562 RepID=UPI001E55E730